jgi:hypothetical protein
VHADGRTGGPLGIRVSAGGDIGLREDLGLAGGLRLGGTVRAGGGELVGTVVDWQPSADLPALGGDRTASEIALTGLAGWEGEGRVHPGLGLEGGASSRTFAQAGQAVGAVPSGHLGLLVFLECRLRGRVDLEPWAETRYTLRPIEMDVDGDRTPVGRLMVRLGLAASVRLGGGG